MRDERSALRTFIVRLTLVAVGVVFAFALLEAALQTGALYVRLKTGREARHGWLTGSRRVLCVGDSNTYGVWLSDRSLAYPQQLEVVWNETVKTPRIEVLNLGYPGTNSSRLRKQFTPMLESLLPDVVIVMVGANDQWTVPMPLDDEAAEGGWLNNLVARRSRVYELLYMLRRSFSAAPLELETLRQERDGGAGTFRYGDREFSMGWQRAKSFDMAFRPKLEKNLRFLVDETRRRALKLVLMTYPSMAANYGDAGTSIRRIAAETGTLLIDLGAAFNDVCPAEPCPRWLLRDHHPTAEGYHRIAETVARELRNEL
jgi:lysophospholipase L1-like esterase